MNKKLQALGRLPAGTMNAAEKQYAYRLEMQKRAGEILWFMFEPAGFRLAKATYYHADFWVMTKDMALQVHEVKGRWTDDARVKIKVAASMFPFQFFAVYAKRSGKSYAFEFEEI